jgi:histidinol-phosphate/aromatic aminotransferase/cobyric acid decarboxylase-like protein
MVDAISRLPKSTNVWVDEAYIDYVGSGHSLERFASQMDNVIVCKSLSKAYALSGLRAAYLVASTKRTNELKRLTPPWAISLPAQVAAVKALQNLPYYMDRYAETHLLRGELLSALRKIEGVDALEGCANSILLHLDRGIEPILESCRQRGVYLRDVASMFQASAPRALRVSVRSAAENTRIAEALSLAMDSVLAAR